MAWRNVIITQQCKISAKYNILVVQTKTDIHEIPLDDIDLLFIQTTRAVLTTHAAAECLKKNIRLLFCDETSMPIGELSPFLSNNARVRNIKAQIAWTESRKQSLWQYIVKEKISHQAKVLEDNDCPDASKLRSLVHEIINADETNREAVAARLYFPRLFSYEFARADETNPINALLNYGYSLLLSETARQITIHGYLTELGIHHDSDKNTFNLACDLMEPFRPYMDQNIHSLPDTVLTPERKIELVKSMSDRSADRHTTIRHDIEMFVADSLRYLSAESNDLPKLGFIK